jgi:hypothetical protein
VTQEDKLIWRMDAKLSIKEDFIGKSVKSQSLKCYGHVNLKEEICLTDSTLTRKASSELLGDRTANRHR